jgi:hypothetical protein
MAAKEYQWKIEMSSLPQLAAQLNSCGAAWEVFSVVYDTSVSSQPYVIICRKEKK